MGFQDKLDRAIGVVSPRLARRRLQERAAITVLERSYDGANKGYRTGGWTTGATSADGQIAMVGSVLRARMRDLVRNNPLAAQAVQVLVNNFVGPGIKPQADTGDAKLNKKINALFETWVARSDASGRTNFYGQQSLTCREMLEGGEVFALQHVLRSSVGAPVPLQIELLEADHLDETKSRTASRGRARIENGIEFDAGGRRIGYWLFPDHPGALNINSGRFQSVRRPANQVLHIFESQRVQNRGVPWGSPSLLSLRDLGDWQQAELVRKKTEACLVGVVSGDGDDAAPGVLNSGSSETSGITDRYGAPVDQLSPGMFFYNQGGGSVEFNNPSSAGGVAEWNRVQMHLIAAGFRVPYALMTGDMSQANFASGRLGLNEFRRMVSMVQSHILIPQFCAPVWGWFVELAKLMGHIPQDTIVGVKWVPPRFETVNPLQDTSADLMEVRAGFSTLQEQVAKRGGNLDATLAEFARIANALDSAALVFDSDPRRVSKVGVAQSHAAKDGAEDL